MSQHENPRFEQEDIPGGFEWGHPLADRFVKVLQITSEENDEFSLEESSDTDSLRDTDQLKLLYKGAVIASMARISHQHSTVHGFNFIFRPDDDQESNRPPSSVRFYINPDATIQIHVDMAAGGLKYMYDPSNPAVALLRRTDRAVDGLFTAWLTDLDTYEVEFIDNSEDLEPCSEGLTKAYQGLLIEMLGAREQAKSDDPRAE